MPRKRKYDALTHYLKDNGGKQVTLTFSQMDVLLFPKTGLPYTARTERDWWNNYYRHSENGAYGWLSADYEVLEVNFPKEYVVFGKAQPINWLTNDR